MQYDCSCPSSHTVGHVSIKILNTVILNYVDFAAIHQI